MTDPPRTREGLVQQIVEDLETLAVRQAGIPGTPGSGRAAQYLALTSFHYMLSALAAETVRYEEAEREKRRLAAVEHYKVWKETPEGRARIQAIRQQREARIEALRQDRIAALEKELAECRGEGVATTGVTGE